MPTKLFIVESPGKIKKLNQILGSDWIVKARELASDGIDSLGFDLAGDRVQCRFVLRGERGKDTIIAFWKQSKKRIISLVQRALVTTYHKRQQAIAVGVPPQKLLAVVCGREELLDLSLDLLQISLLCQLELVQSCTKQQSNCSATQSVYGCT